MIARPCANAIATIPASPTPSPTTAAVPAPMNTNAKVPMNSARSFGAIRLDIIDSEDEIGAPRDQICAKGRYVADGTGERRRPVKRAGLLRGDGLRLFESKGLRHPSPVCGIRARAIVDMPLLDVELGVAHRPRRILEQQELLRGRHFSEKVAGLLPMVIVDTVVPMRRIAFDRHRRFGEIGLVVPKPRAVGVEGKRVAQVAVGAHLAIAVVALERALGSVDRDMVEIDAEPIALGVAIGEQSPLEHLVRRKADTGYDVGGREGCLLHFREIVVRIAIELHCADLDQWILRLRPDLGNIEGTVFMN